jgi:chromosome segregation ATPase
MDLLSSQVSAVVAKRTELEKKCTKQEEELEHLRAQNQYYLNEMKVLDDLRMQYEASLEEKNSEILNLHVLVDQLKTDCQLFKDDLVKVRAEYELLSDKHVAVKQQFRDADAKIARRELQIKNLVTIMRRKIATNRVITIAFKAAYKVLPTLQEKCRYARILELAKQAPCKDGLSRELTGVLKEAGFNLVWAEPDAAIQTPEQKSEEPTAAAAEKDVNMQISPQGVTN